MIAEIQKLLDDESAFICRNKEPRSKVASFLNFRKVLILNGLNIEDLLEHKNITKTYEDPFEIQGNSTFLHILAIQGFDVILKHPEVSKVKNEIGETPLYILANKGHGRIMEHPDCFTGLRISRYTNNSISMYGTTPVHALASQGNIAILRNPLSLFQKCDSKETPLMRLNHTRPNIPKDIIIKNYPELDYIFGEKRYLDTEISKNIAGISNLQRFLNDW